MNKKIFITQQEDNYSDFKYNNIISELSNYLGLPHERENILKYFDNNIYPLIKMKEKRYYDTMFQAFKGELKRQISSSEIRLKELTENYKEKEKLVDLLRSQIMRESIFLNFIN